MEKLINKTLEYVEDFFKEDFSGHDFYHTLRVYNLAKYIAQFEKCDTELVYLAALLHDVDDYKLVGKEQDPFHNAKTFLEKHNYPYPRIEQICHIISQVSFSSGESAAPDTIEGKIVQDADRLGGMGAIAIARTFAYGGANGRHIHIPDLKPNMDMNNEEYSNNTGTSINHFYEKLLKLKDLINTETARELAEHRHQYMQDFLKEFYDEWNGRK